MSTAGPARFTHHPQWWNHSTEHPTLRNFGESILSTIIGIAVVGIPASFILSTCFPEQTQHFRNHLSSSFHHVKKSIEPAKDWDGDHSSGRIKTHETTGLKPIQVHIHSDGKLADVDIGISEAGEILEALKNDVSDVQFVDVESFKASRISRAKTLFEYLCSKVNEHLETGDRRFSIDTEETDTVILNTVDGMLQQRLKDEGYSVSSIKRIRSKDCAFTLFFDIQL